MKTISNLDTINVQTHGFSRDGIPEAGDTVRIDVFGGFVLQRITKERSFFRAIANMDIKLDFVPPWLINFMSRQLIGSGHKLYQKAVSTVATCDDDYKRALRGPLYTRIREYQDSDDKAKVNSTEENATEAPPANPTVQNRLAVTNTTSNCEIVEEESEQSTEIRQTYSFPSKKINDRADDVVDKDSLKNSTASTVTKTMSMTLRSAIRVHGEESLETNGLHQNGFGKNKEPKRVRKAKRWPCCLTPTTIG
nr:unnamed protein product [Digitaria exilis]